MLKSQRNPGNEFTFDFGDNLIKPYPFPVTGEKAYHLTPDGLGFLEDTNTSKRALKPVAFALQLHEYEVSRFWLKFYSDCRALSLIPQFHLRDGQLALKLDKDRILPDGAVCLTIRNRPFLFLLELDRSTQTSGLQGSSRAVFKRKLNAYSKRKELRQALHELGIPRLRIMTIVVCQNEKRLRSLCTLAEQSDFQEGVAFTCKPRFIKEGANPRK